MLEKDLGKSSILSKQMEDKRDRAFASVAPFDWELGFDIELLLGYRAICKDEAEFFGIRGREGWGVDRYREIVDEVKKKNIPPFKIPVKNQGISSSCVGQALSYYLEILNFIETGEYKKISARDIYAYISLGEGVGAYLRDGLKLTCNRGVGTEELVPCYHEFETDHGIVRNPYSEKEYLEKPEETDELKEVRSILKSKEYKSVKGFGPELMDKMAWAMLMGLGVFFAVDGENGRGWTSEYPQIPLEVAWSHALFGGKAFLENNKKTISPINSWGNSCGVEGWQKLQSDYFAGYFVYSPWTLIDLNNNWNDMSNNQNVKIIKDENSPAVGVWLPFLSPEAMESVCLNFGIEVPKNEKGEIEWDKAIQGTLKLK
ncbi:MAG: hypothetical protein EOL88_00730 [Bacteroidia bacterium]|nr:hypothetical protein [Bacteroidia bacterium]